MKTRYRNLAILVVAVFLAKFVFAETAASASQGQPVAFEWTYKYDPDPGKRSWVFANNVWTETRASGKKVKYQPVEKTVVREYNLALHGMIVRQTDDPTFDVFIPDLDNQFRWAFFRFKEGQWQYLSSISGVH